jgi:F-type H+-transporting ATPase subunit delta
MSDTIRSSTLAAYARSLFELAEQRGQLESVSAEVAQIQELLEQNPAFATLLADPSVKRTDREGMLQRALEGHASPLVYNFLLVLSSHDRLGQLSGVLEAFQALVDAKLGKVEVDVTTASALNAEELSEVRERVSRALGCDAVVHPYVDESIIGGMILRIGDRLIDGSVRAQLEAMRKKLLAAAPR